MTNFRAIYSSDLSHRARVVYMYLADRADRDGKCWPAIKTIAAELNLSRSTVKRALDVDRGTVHEEPSRRTHSIRDFNTENSQYHSEFFINTSIASNILFWSFAGKTFDRLLSMDDL